MLLARISAGLLLVSNALVFGWLLGAMVKLFDNTLRLQPKKESKDPRNLDVR